MRGAEAVIRALEKEGVKYIAGFSGGGLNPLWEPLRTSESIKVFATRHERLGVEIADGYARACGKPAYLIDGVWDLREDWFSGAETVLVTAGASAPEEVVEECVAYLRDHYGATVESRTVREEHVSFPLPRELRVIAG